MVIELGHFALILALLVALLQTLAPWLGAWRGKTAWMQLGRQAAISTFWLTSISVLSLVHAYALSDFSVLNVASNSNTMKPMIYKLTGMWGNHEGSMLLWLWMLSLWGAWFARPKPDSANLPFHARVLGTQGAIYAGFAAFVLLASSPFARLLPAAPEGLDLNPVLQDPLLIIHPPFLYAGAVGFSLAFSAAIAALAQGEIPRDLAQKLRPLVLLPWALLTIGITLGGFWAYYELGWGGFWFWDPVENVSLLPWLSGTALLHSLATLARRGALPGWTLLLAILTFLLVVMGAFLVRSGLLTSVHSFAADPLRGLFILSLFSVLAGSALTLYAVKTPRLPQGAVFGWLSRDAAILANNIFMATALTTVALGTLYPLVMAALDLPPLSVGAPYYMAVMMPLIIPFALLMGTATHLAWDKTPRHFYGPLVLPLLAVVAGVMFWATVDARALNPALLIGVGGGAWIILSAAVDMWRKRNHLPLRYLAMQLAHIGFALLLIGATFSTQLKTEDTRWMQGGDKTAVAGQPLLLIGVESGLGRNFNTTRAIFSLVPASGDTDKARFLMPEKRWYPVSETATSETALAVQGLDVIYVVLGDEDKKTPGRFVVRIYHHPMVLLVFIGGGLMALGALVAAAKRRQEGAV